MARVTVEDCLENVDNRFQLVMLATKRARQLATKGAEPMVAATGADSGAAGSAEFRALAATARGHYQAALTAQREGDWARYGEEIRKLGEVLARMGDRPR